jgi:uncharacterized protein (TIGR02246 family)
MIVLVTLSIALTGREAVRAQEPTAGELRRLSDAFAQAWAKADQKAMTGLFSTEAIRIGGDGKVNVGRAAIEQAALEELSGPYRGTKIGLTPGQTTRVAQDVYTSEGTFQISGGLPPAGYAVRGRYLNTIVRTNGRWLIASHAMIPVARTAK